MQEPMATPERLRLFDYQPAFPDSWQATVLQYTVLYGFLLIIGWVLGHELSRIRSHGEALPLEPTAQVVSSKDGLWLSIAVTLGMALVTGLVQPFAQPQANTLQSFGFASALAIFSTKHRLGTGSGNKKHPIALHPSPNFLRSLLLWNCFFASTLRSDLRGI